MANSPGAPKSSSKPKKNAKRGAEVAARLRNDIVRGVLAEGSHLPPEFELMKQFGISRPTLREALRILESQLLITVKRGTREGAVVHLPGPDVVSYHMGLYLEAHNATIRDNFAARVLVESAAIRLLIEANHINSAVKALTKISDEFERGIEQNDVKAMGREAVKFHETLHKLTESPALNLLTGTLNKIFAHEMRSLSDEFYFDRDSGSYQLSSQRQLIELIAGKKITEAVTHWRNVLQREMEWIGERIPLDRKINTQID